MRLAQLIPTSATCRTQHDRGSCIFHYLVSIPYEVTLSGNPARRYRVALKSYPQVTSFDDF